MPDEVVEGAVCDGAGAAVRFYHEHSIGKSVWMFHRCFARGAEEL